MLLTQNYRLRKPEGTDPVDVKDFNDNADVIDAELAKKAEKTGAASDMVTSFTQASSRNNLTSGEKLSTSLGKIMKFFVDLKAVAFSGSFNDLSNRPNLGAAASYKVANNDTTTIEGYVADARIVRQHGLEIDQINGDLSGVHITTEGSGADTKYYAQIGADTASKKPLGGKVLTSIGRTTIIIESDIPHSYSFDVKNIYSGYNKLTIDDFLLTLPCPQTFNLWSGTALSQNLQISQSYNSTTGIYVINTLSGSYDGIRTLFTIQLYILA